MDIELKRAKKLQRHKRVRRKVVGRKSCPRLCVFRSNKHIYAQLIDDEKNKVLAVASDLNFKSKIKIHKLTEKKSEEKKEPPLALATEGKEKPMSRKLAIAYEVGLLIAKKAKDLKIEKVVFDRGGYKYHGQVKALAEGAREGGVKF